MTATMLDPTSREWTAVELRRLPVEDRNAILAAAAERANDDYIHDQTLTAFQAFGEGDLHGRSSNTEPQ